MLQEGQTENTIQGYKRVSGQTIESKTYMVRKEFRVQLKDQKTWSELWWMIYYCLVPIPSVFEWKYVYMCAFMHVSGLA